MQGMKTKKFTSSNLYDAYVSPLINHQPDSDAGFLSWIEIIMQHGFFGLFGACVWLTRPGL